MELTWVGDPGGDDSDPTCEKKPDPGPTNKKQTRYFDSLIYILYISLMLILFKTHDSKSFWEIF